MVKLGKLDSRVVQANGSPSLNGVPNFLNGSPNFPNRSIYIGDNLNVMRTMNDSCVDLIYLDPPFNSNRTYSAPIGSDAAGAAFKDTWTRDDVDDAWAGLIAEKYPAVFAVCRMAELAHSDGMYSYLVMMGKRLIEMHRILKDTGSLFLHCDPTASHYLKSMLDAIFGRGNFRNEIVWERIKGAGKGSRGKKKAFGRSTDALFAYTKTPLAEWNVDAVALPYPNVEKKFNCKDEKGRYYRRSPFRPPGLGPAPNCVYEYKGVYPPHSSGWIGTKTFVENLDANNDLEWLENGRVYRKQRPGAGIPLSNFWGDIPQVGGNEDTGYPTQKPLALLERIIKASTNEGDVVLDPFCGCATTLVAAESLGRQWVGIDISGMAYDLIRQRLLEKMDEGILFKGGRYKEPHKFENNLPPKQVYGGKMAKSKAKPILFGRSKGRCNKCEHEFPFGMFDVDHVHPKAHGGPDELENYQLLCVRCHRYKSTLSDEAHTAKLREKKIIA